MPPRVRLKRCRPTGTNLCPYHQLQLERAIARQWRFASTAAATAPIDQTIHAAQYPPTQPPSLKPPEFRKSQLLRQYASLLQSCPLVLLFQHSNLKSAEWMAIRRELALALHKTDEKEGTHYSDRIKMHIVQTGIIAAALRLITFYTPHATPQPPSSKAKGTLDPSTHPVPPNHILSPHAHRLTRTFSRRGQSHGLEPLLSGPLMLLTFPLVSPTHLATALSLLSPSAAFPAPKRRASPGYWDPAVQSGVQKLLLLGARAEGTAMDGEGVKWAGGIEGMERVRGELVGVIGGEWLKVSLVRMMKGVGGGLVGALEGARGGVWWTLEGRRRVLERDGEGGS